MKVRLRVEVYKLKGVDVIDLSHGSMGTSNGPDFCCERDRHIRG